MEHTKEPWSIDKYESIQTNDGQLLLGGVVTPMTVGQNRNIANANARRIVACVNALKGVATEWLESYTASNVENVLQENARFKQQRDELLAALKAIRSVCLDRRKSLSEFERLGDLYYLEFGRLRPGKDDPLRDSCDEENTAQYDEWSRKRAEAALDLVDASIAKAEAAR